MFQRVSHVCGSILVAALLVVTMWPAVVCAQPQGALGGVGAPGPGGPGGMPGGSIPPSMFGSKKEKREVSGPSLTATDEQVVEIRVTGNKTIPTEQVLNQLQTRVGRPFDPALVQTDVRKLWARGWFVDVQPVYEQGNGGRVVIFKVVERPIIRFVEYLGNASIRTNKLERETELKVGGPVDPYAVEEARRKIVALYHRNGFNNVQVTIWEGNKATDEGVTFVINEGVAQKVWKTVFEGNTFASDGQLRTKIDSKKPIMYIFKGYLDREVVEADVEKITAYYRAFGYFQAKVSRKLEPTDDEGKWFTVRFIISEGMRYSVENVSFIGNKLFASESLAMGIKMPGGEPFEQSRMNNDLEWLKEVYGSQGYVFANIEPDIIYLEEPGKVNLMYKIEEGKRWRIGNIFVKIEGENPHTKIQTALNRLSFRSGEIADIREIRASERRLRASGLYMNEPAKGVTPKIVFNIPELSDRELASGENPGFRGQSPDHPTTPRPLVADIKPRPLVAETHGPPLIAPPVGPPSRGGPGLAAPTSADSGSARLAEPTYSRTYQVPTPADFVPSEDQIDICISLDGDEPTATLVPDAAQEGATAPAPLSPTAIVHEVRRYPYEVRQQVQPAASPYQQLTVRTQSPYQPPTSQVATAPAASATTGYGGQAVGATGPQATPAGANPYAVQQAVGTTANATAPPVSQAQYTQPAPAFAPPPMSTEQLPPPAGYVPGPPPGAPVYGGPPPLPPSPNVTPISPLDPTVSQVPYPADTFTPLDPAVDMNVVVSEAPTGRIMLGVAVNSDAGLMGQLMLDEQNFDWRRPPTSWEDIVNGRAWRGDGQRFRAEAAPGTQVHRYLVSWQQPYLMDTPVSLGLSGSFFNRRYEDWDEERLGGRVSLGYQWVENDLSTALAYRGENVKISDISTPIPELLEVRGDNALHGFKWTIANDTRDSAFLATEGHFLQLEVEQVIGSFDYPRAIVEARQYWLMRERADRSGRHVVTASTRVGFTGSNTPIYDNFFAGGFSTLRGFDFRGASPVVSGVEVGGEFMWVNTVEYLFPLTADDMIHGVAFCDFGTVEQKVEIEDFRVSPGFGLRIMIPAMGPAPIALDFAFPVAKAEFDDEQMFSFNIGLQR